MTEENVIILNKRFVQQSSPPCSIPLILNMPVMFRVSNPGEPATALDYTEMCWFRTDLGYTAASRPLCGWWRSLRGSPGPGSPANTPHIHHLSTGAPSGGKGVERGFTCCEASPLIMWCIMGTSPFSSGGSSSIWSVIIMVTYIHGAFPCAAAVETRNTCGSWLIWQ